MPRTPEYADFEREPPRILGSYDAGVPGPLVVVVGGLHGNEPAGVAAALAVLEAIERRRPPIAGRLVALAGNRAALKAGQRFVDDDLNRCWTSERVARLRAGERPLGSSEEREMRDILGVLEGELAAASGPVVLLDLHSTSAHGAPFTILADTLQNRRIARRLPIPIVMGLEERIEGPLLSWFADRGHAALVVEGGAHEHPATVGHHQAAIWLTLFAAGGLAWDEAEEIADGHERLARAARGLPFAVEALYGHALRPGDGFSMQPGFENLQRVRTGEVLASSREGDVRAPWDGFVLMPLYQSQGRDGFFMCRAVARSWLWLSGWARRGRLELLLGGLPGLELHASLPAAVTVEGPPRPSVAWALKLFGYRKHAQVGARELYRRRAEGSAPDMWEIQQRSAREP